MSIIASPRLNSPTLAASPHPDWCEARSCDAGRFDHATRHAGPPTTWRVSADDVELTVQVQQNHEHGQAASEIGVLLTTYNTQSVWPGGNPIYSSVFLHAADIDELTARLALVIAALAEASA